MPQHYSLKRFDANNPLYQRELQKEAGRMGPKRLSRVVAGQVGAKHADYQGRRNLAFHQLALQKKASEKDNELAKARLEYQAKQLGLGEAQLGFNRSMFDKTRKDLESELGYTIATGLLGTGFSALEGRRREKALQSSLARQRVRDSRINYLLQDLIQAKSPGFYATGEEQ